MLKKFKAFLREARQELKRITWPTRQETIKLTLMVIFLSLFVAVMLGFFDLGFSYALQKFIIK